MDLMHFQWETFARTSAVAMASVWSTWKTIPTLSAGANPHFMDPTASHVSEQKTDIYTLMWIFNSRIWKEKKQWTLLCLHQCHRRPANTILAKMKAPASKVTAKRFHCTCPDGYTGKFCETAQRSLTQWSRIKTRDTFSSNFRRWRNSTASGDSSPRPVVWKTSVWTGIPTLF